MILMLGGPLGGQPLSDSFITVFQELAAGEPGTQLALHKYILNLCVNKREAAGSKTRTWVLTF